jgi:predicted transposase/invertase (TIGR01784 family)
MNMEQNMLSVDSNNQSPKLVRFDWAIKNLLRNKANFDILEGFLSELLKEQIKIDSLLESESNQFDEDNKFNRVDLLVSTDTNEKIIIEVQTVSEWDFYHRILFGTSKVITEYIDKGQSYSQVPKVISVSILFFNLGVGSDYVYKGTTDFTGVHTNDSLQLSDSSIDLYINKLNKTYTSPSDIFPTYYIIQLKKFADKIRDKFDEWVYLLKHESIKSGFNAQGILSAKEKLDVLKLSAKDRQAYDKYWQNMSFEASLVETHQVELEQATRWGKREGIEIGRQEGIELGKQEGVELGRQNAQKEIARQLLKSGVNKVIVAKSTNLTLVQIDELLKDIN